MMMIIIIIISRVRPLVCSVLTITISFLDVTSLFWLWDYIRRQSSEFVIDPFVGNVFPNGSRTDFNSNRPNWEVCDYSRDLVTEMTVLLMLTVAGICTRSCPAFIQAPYVINC